MERFQNFFINLWGKFRAWIDTNPRRAALWAGAILLLIIGFFIPVDEPHVALSGEAIFSGGPAWLTNTIVTTLVVDLIIILMAVLATARMKLIPTGWQNVMEAVVEALYKLAEDIAGHRARTFFPWAATIFIFVVISSWSGLIPGVGSIGFFHEEANLEEGVEAGEQALSLERRLALADGSLALIQPISQDLAPELQEDGAEGEGAVEEDEAGTFVPLFRAPSADLNVTFALALITVVIVQYWGIRTLKGSYFNKFWNFRGENVFMKGINGFVGILEIISEFSRLLAFGFRLFGNIFAGEVVLATMAFLIPFLLPIPFYILEVFVGFIQALVFMMLALAFFNLATIAHHHEHEEHDAQGHTEVHEHVAPVDSAATV